MGCGFFQLSPSLLCPVGVLQHGVGAARPRECRDSLMLLHFQAASLPAPFHGGIHPLNNPAYYPVNLVFPPVDF